MNNLRPNLFILVPAHCEVIPARMAKLERFVADKVGGTVTLKFASSSIHADNPFLMFLGSWSDGVKQKVEPMLHQLVHEATSRRRWLDNAV